MLEQTGEIKALPSKALFIDMMTRDIGLADAVLDLIDNAVDKAIELSQFNAMQVLLEGERPRWPAVHHISITIGQRSFTIADTCGGMSSDEARNSVFLLGNPDERGAKSGLSVFGIGLKRAIFKIGRYSTIESTTANERLRVKIDVRSWRDTDDWSFDFDELGANTPPLPDTRWGTKVEVRDLHPNVAARFSDPTFLDDLEARISATYALFLTAGLRIRVNGRTVASALPEIASGTVTSARKRFNYGDVDILVLATLAPLQDTRPRGWYVFCNGRMVLDGERTDLTGWGRGLPSFHVGKYRRFLGFVYFASEDVRSLPWRTTKQGVDPENAAYRAALAEMIVQGRAVTAFLDSLYPRDVEADPTLEREVIAKATPRPLDQVGLSDAAFSVTLPRPRPRETISIQFHRPKTLVERIAAHVGKRGLSASKVGELTFDYYVDQELE